MGGPPRGDGFEPDMMHGPHPRGMPLLPPPGPSGPLPDEPVMLQEVLLAKRLAGVLIGTGGSNVSIVRRESRCKVHVTEVRGPEQMQAVELTGTEKQIALAVASIRRILTDFDVEHKVEMKPTVETTVEIYPVMVGSVLGKAGATIKVIRQKSGAHVRVEDLQPGESMQLVMISGSVEQVKLAYIEVKGIIDRFDPSKVKGGPPMLPPSRRAPIMYSGGGGAVFDANTLNQLSSSINAYAQHTQHVPQQPQHAQQQPQHDPAAAAVAGPAAANPAAAAAPAASAGAPAASAAATQAPAAAAPVYGMYGAQQQQAQAQPQQHQPQPAPQQAHPQAQAQPQPAAAQQQASYGAYGQSMAANSMYPGMVGVTGGYSMTQEQMNAYMRGQYTAQAQQQAQQQAQAQQAAYSSYAASYPYAQMYAAQAQQTQAAQQKPAPGDATQQAAAGAQPQQQQQQAGQQAALPKQEQQQQAQAAPQVAPQQQYAYYNTGA
ncbi:Poly(rC)-binding protein 4 [Tetrabaena socialis]|uniref:Poly(RC)-binding protein 4 n=1 Tax=Tetrabaena socialis TaxID=47790 RepID=A0A2J7ZZ91_9CHLO|nr:Poly(rC)-binding protein 4 [Tetrabaena socialis]|eukprot:PNH05566.1 Poly(rC)-binding protein 4 [Tetrabaena socialis]